MLIRSTRWHLILSALCILVAGACGGTGGCGACAAVQPLPGGRLPADQTVEGGAQIRVTQQGFSKLTSILPALLGEQLSNGFCVPPGSFGTPSGGLGTGANYCDGHPSPTCSTGCLVNVSLNPGGLVTSVAPSQQAVNLKISTTASSTIHLDGQVVGVDFACTLAVTTNDLTADLDVAVAIDPATGELTVHVARVNALHLGLDFSGCGPVSSIADLADAIIDSFLGQFLTGLLRPAIDSLIQGFLPRQTGLVGVLDVGNLLAGLSPGTQARMEAQLVPGGYVQLRGNGMSLGVITGLNSDRNPATRTPGLASEPALCAPPLPRPDFGAVPTSLPLTSRSTYAMPVADAFNGIPSDPATDVAIGLSETTLDLAGHHLVTSGALCLGVGTSFVPQLNVGTLGLLVRSLGSLQSGLGVDPVLLVTRPQRDLRFTIGENTVASPALTLGIDHLEVDFYAFVFERYVRAFTLDVSTNIGVNLEFEQAAGAAAKIRPTLVGISSNNVKIKVLDSDFVKESPESLEAVLPTVFNLVTPLLGNLPEITLPPFAGFQLENLSIQHVATNQDDFLAIYAQLGASTLVPLVAARGPAGASAVTAVTAIEAAQAAPSTGQARLTGVTTPAPDRIRAALRHEPDGALPSVAFEVDARDAAGRELEWTYQLDGGMWRPWRSGAALVIEDAAFVWQGKYTIGLKSRVKGDYHTVSEARQFPVIIDSVPPQIAVDRAAWNGEVYEVPAFDIVSGRALQYAFGKPGSSAPGSPWFAGGTVEVSRDAAGSYLDGGKLAVFARDEAGNTAVALVGLDGEPGGGCACDAQGSPGAGGLVVLLAAASLVRRRRVAAAASVVRRRRVAIAALCMTGAIALPGCGGSKPAADSCEMASDCNADDCNPGELAFCVENACVCSGRVPPGRLGLYSDVAVGPDGATWVSAYAQTHGDLVVARATGGRIPDDAWEWVDGVPDGPVAVNDVTIRRGIVADGPDVGLYTSIAVGPDGPMVSYFDRETGSLKLAQRVGGSWQIHVVDAGTGKLAAGAVVGMYSSLTLRSDDGRPGIAYLAHVQGAAGARAEVRFASAQTPHPTAAGDWMQWVVDSAPLPPDDPANPSLYPLPQGVGLFIDSARMPDQAPVVAYYDRTRGDLKVARFNVQTGQFAAARVLDGGTGVDVGWSPSVAVDSKGVVHVAYVSATAGSLKYLTDAANALPEVIDDGYRIDGTTVDGLPRPVFHLVGADAGIALPPDGSGPYVVYQDATTQELLLAHRQADGWHRSSIAGATQPWPGAYGFFAASAIRGAELVMSSWVVDLPASDYFDSNWVEVFRRPTTSP